MKQERTCPPQTRERYVCPECQTYELKLEGAIAAASSLDTPDFPYGGDLFGI